jgi:O-antigen ligase
LLWPLFEAAAAKAPWFGWGLGSGNLVIPRTSLVVELLHTWAAHNEYLRIQVEGGYVGRTLLIALFVLWAVSRTRRLPALEKVVMRFVFITFAAHAMTDNVLISTPACVFFAFIAAIYAEADDAASNCLRTTPDVA